VSVYSELPPSIIMSPGSNNGTCTYETQTENNQITNTDKLQNIHNKSHIYSYPFQFFQCPNKGDTSELHDITATAITTIRVDRETSSVLSGC